MLKRHFRTALRPELLLVVALVVVLTVMTSALPVALGQTENPAQDQVIADAERRSQALEGEISSVNEQIAKVQANLKAAEAKRVETEQAIAKLTDQTRALVPVISAKNAEWQHKQDLLKEALHLDYTNRARSVLEVIAETGSLSGSLTTSTYRYSLEKKLDSLAAAAKLAKEDLADRKQTLDQQRSSLEVLQRQLTALAQNVAQQQVELAELLANRTNEAAYLKQKIEQAKAQQESLLQGATQWGTYIEGAWVKRDDIIGFEGSTGFSTGCHLHFSVIDKARWADPELYWTVLSKPTGGIFQPFGMTEYAKSGAYGGKIHNGVDFVQDCGKPIRASADGQIIRDNRTDGSGFGHYVMIRHDNGLITLYGHML